MIEKKSFVSENYFDPLAAEGEKFHDVADLSDFAVDELRQKRSKDAKPKPPHAHQR